MNQNLVKKDERIDLGKIAAGLNYGNVVFRNDEREKEWNDG